MTDKTEIWDKLCKTDPDQTKGFTRAGGFRGTAIKPIWIIKRMTEEFGPCGTGWGISTPEFTVEHAQEESLVFCVVAIWYDKIDKKIFGVGGDKFRTVIKRGTDSEYIQTDDEAFKKAYTDAVGNALKFLGVGADVHMGLFDDSKYVQELRNEKSNAKAPPAAEMKRGLLEVDKDLLDAKSMPATMKLFQEWQEKMDAEFWPDEHPEDGNYRHMLREKFSEHRGRLEAQAISSDPDDPRTIQENTE